LTKVETVRAVGATADGITIVVGLKIAPTDLLVLKAKRMKAVRLAMSEARVPSAKNKGLVPSAKTASHGPTKGPREKAMRPVVNVHRENPKNPHNQEIQLRTVITSQKEIVTTAVEAGADILATADQKAMKPERIQRPPILPHENFRFVYNNRNLLGVV
jgi:hypothetical protein